MTKRAADLIKGDKILFCGKQVTIGSRKARWDDRTQQWVVTVISQRGSITNVGYTTDATVEIA